MILRDYCLFIRCADGMSVMFFKVLMNYISMLYFCRRNDIVSGLL